MGRWAGALAGLIWIAAAATIANWTPPQSRPIYSVGEVEALWRQAPYRLNQGLVSVHGFGYHRAHTIVQAGGRSCAYMDLGEHPSPVGAAEAQWLTFTPSLLVVHPGTTLPDGSTTPVGWLLGLPLPGVLSSTAGHAFRGTLVTNPPAPCPRAADGEPVLLMP